MYNLNKLLKELAGAGLPIVGIEAVGELVGERAKQVKPHWGTPEVTTEMQARANAILAMHDPFDKTEDDARNARDTLKTGATLEELEQALARWDEMNPAEQKKALQLVANALVLLIQIEKTRL